MNDFNNIPKSGSFGDIVDVVNQNFALAKEELDKAAYGSSNCLGYYETAADLQAAHATAEEGEWAFVGTTTPYAMYVYTNDAWTNTGTEYELNVLVQDSRIEALESQMSQISLGTTEADGFFYTDNLGYIAMKYTPLDGFDVAKVSDHFLSLVGGGGGGGADGYIDLSSEVYDVPTTN